SSCPQLAWARSCRAAACASSRPSSSGSGRRAGSSRCSGRPSGGSREAPDLPFRTAICIPKNSGSSDQGGMTMPRYGKKASQKVEKAMHEKKRGTLKSGRSGKKVTSRKQAIAIGRSEARQAGGKVPKKKSSSKKRKKS